MLLTETHMDAYGSAALLMHINCSRGS
ncbi:hypothetical protein CO2235_U840013 [Cupriavidus oxalaticus]|uniref:Uncharacterized protein n=1 Tax=Cupriavidus oxalaticus TaxID=96344 RepID=A0A375FQZ2_9BURK|nr:hypothetical protein CO2235_U840013 [Cupriavidus oxalaticus]